MYFRSNELELPIKPEVTQYSLFKYSGNLKQDPCLHNSNLAMSLWSSVLTKIPKKLLEGQVCKTWMISQNSSTNNTPPKVPLTTNLPNFLDVDALEPAFTMNENEVNWHIP